MVPSICAWVSSPGAPSTRAATMRAIAASDARTFVIVIAAATWAPQRPLLLVAAHAQLREDAGMRSVFLLSLVACAGRLNGATRQLDDGRTVRVSVVHVPGSFAPCATFVRSAPGDEIVLDDDAHCPDLQDMLAHELGHANGHVHEEGGVMMPIPNETVIQK